MRYETTRTDAMPDTTSLAHAADHAREACRLDPGLAEAWATLGFVHGCQGQLLEALAALRRAVTMEPDNWRHQFRLAFASWGEERLRASRRTLAMLPGFPLAHFLAATVHVARNLLDEAERELRAGIVGQDAQGPLDSLRSLGAGRKFTAVALHWLLGLVVLAKGDEDGALAEFERELAAEASGHLYSRECCANTCYAIGALRLRQGREMEAQQAFAEALRRVPNHRLVTVVAGARKLAASRQRHSVSHAALDVFTNKDGPFDERFVLGIALAAIGETTRAIALIDEAMVDAPPGSAGWLLPVEPLLNVRANPEAWTSALARLQARVA
jgi:tetratricopeptide (TPR) repeat protein